MAISRLNYTGRKRISQKDITITVCDQPEGSPVFDAELRLGRYGLPNDAHVFVEARRQTIWMRFSYGQVGALLTAGGHKLVGFDSSDGILFRVIVTSSGERTGVILAEADTVRARRPHEADEDRLPLLPVRAEEMEGEVCRVGFTGNDPELLINEALGDWRAVACSPLFRSLVAPAVMRQILTWILHLGEYPDLEDRDDPKTRWLLFAANLPGVGRIPAEDDDDRFDEWIDVAVSSFAKQSRLLDHFTSFWEREQGR